MMGHIYIDNQAQMLRNTVKHLLIAQIKYTIWEVETNTKTVLKVVSSHPWGVGPGPFVWKNF